jgi:hypothetical protein
MIWPGFLSDKAYRHDNRDDYVLGRLIYRGPAVFTHSEWHTIANVPKTGGDGFDCEIQECRMPARSFRLVALATNDSTGHRRPGFILSAGTGGEIGRFIVEAAKHIASGMLTAEDL